MTRPRSSRQARAAGLARLLGVVVTAWALVRELRTPRELRTWNGRVAGFIPYDFRRPTGLRVRERMWNPRDPRLIVPSVFGVGWTLNAGRLIPMLRRLTQRRAV
jgi:hypothetical protein